MATTERGIGRRYKNSMGKKQQARIDAQQAELDMWRRREAERQEQRERAFEEALTALRPGETVWVITSRGLAVKARR